MRKEKRLAKWLVKCENSYRGFLQYVFWDNNIFAHRYKTDFKYNGITARRFGQHLLACMQDRRLWALAHNQDGTFDQSKYEQLKEFAKDVSKRSWCVAQVTLKWDESTSKIDSRSSNLVCPVLHIGMFNRYPGIESTMFAKVFNLKWDEDAVRYSVTLKVSGDFPYTIKTMHCPMGYKALNAARGIILQQELARGSEIDTVEPFSNKYVYLNKPSTDYAESVDQKWSNPVYDAIHAVLDPKFDQLNELMNQRDLLDDQIDALSKEITNIQKEMENVVYYRKP